MRSLGLARDRAEAHIAQPLGPLNLDKDSLFVRSQAPVSETEETKAGLRASQRNEEKRGDVALRS